MLVCLPGFGPSLSVSSSQTVEHFKLMYQHFFYLFSAQNRLSLHSAEELMIMWIMMII